MAAINAIRGAEALSTYAPISEAEKFRIEYWVLEERKLQRRRPKPLTGKIALVTGAARDRAGHRHAPARGGRRHRRRRYRRRGGSHRLPGAGVDDDAIAVQVDVSDEQAVKASIDEMVARFGGVDIVVNNAGLSISKALLETSVEDWDRQHDVMARGSFLVSKHAARVMIAQGPAGTSSMSSARTPSWPVPATSPTARPRPARHIRCGSWPPSWGSTASASTASTPTPSSRDPGSSREAGGRSGPGSTGCRSMSLDGYASRTLLKREVLPEHVANAAFWLISGELTHTTGLIVPVDAGVAAAFLR